ncbi:MAG: dienelactone hydrolase family protein [Chitinophagaceae bacterium]
MHSRNILEAGLRIEEAKKAIILIHGRGGDARGMVDLKEYLPLKDFAILAPQATNNTWYPYSFMAPASANEPRLSSAIDTVHGLIDEVTNAGIPAENIYLAGFSQGACLTLESAARKAQRYGGIIAFTGGLIGETIDLKNYQGDFSGTPILISSGDPDPHVPVSRVHESEAILKEMGAQLIVKLYPGRQHTITSVEVQEAATLIATSY